MKHIFTGLLIMVLLVSCKPQTDLIIYPLPDGLVPSNDYLIEVNDQEVKVEQFTTDYDLDALPEWFTGTPMMDRQQQVCLVSFDCNGPVTVRIEVPVKIDSASIHPLSRGIKLQTGDEGNWLMFTLPGPDKLYIEVNDLPPLLFIANPVESEIPNAQDKNVLYFGPGVHQAGEIDLQDNQTMYIAGGAIVYGHLRGNPQNAKIIGRGILDAGYKTRLALFENASNLTLDGVTLRNSKSWTNTLINCQNVLYHNVKVLGFGPSSDGVNPLGSRNVTIDDCFFRCTDDCIAIKAPADSQIVDSIRVTNNTMIGYMFSDGVTIGYETNGPEVKNVVVNNCDIIIARGGSKVDGHSAFSIICDGPARIHDILYENIRVEQRVIRLFEANITDGTLYGVNPPGHIDGVTLRNISWMVEKPIILKGFDKDHRVKNITFENCTIAGKPLTKDYPLLEINENVEGVQFK